jgi:large subunit ribosomal protein L25
MQKLKLVAEKRKTFGRKVGSLRRKGILPANIYGQKVKSLAIQVPLVEFEKVYQRVGETGVVEVSIGKTKKPVLIHNVQIDPVSDVPIHADFLQVNLKEKVTAAVPVEVRGESPAEKQGLGTVVQYIDEIEVEALPTDLPEKFELDLSSLVEVDQTIQVKDLKLDKKVEIKAEPEQILVKIEPPRKIEEEAPSPKEEEVVEEPSVAEAKEGEGEVSTEEEKEKKEEKKEKESSS